MIGWALTGLAEDVEKPWALAGMEDTKPALDSVEAFLAPGGVENTEPAEDCVKVFSALTGDLLATVVTRQWSKWRTVHGLKDAVFKQTSIPCPEQCLIVDGSILDDSLQLIERVFHGKQRVVLLLRQRSPEHSAALEKVRRNGKALVLLTKAQQQDPEIALTAVGRDEGALIYTGSLQRDREFMLSAVKINPSVLRYAAEDFREDPEFAEAAAAKDPCALRYSLGAALDVALRNHKW